MTYESSTEVHYLGDIMGLKEAAEFMDMSQHTLYKLVQKGRVPASKIGGSWKFRRSAIILWMAKNEEALMAARAQEGDDEAEKA